MNRRVYRVETKDSRDGAYRSGEMLSELSDMGGYGGMQHPSPEKDSGIRGAWMRMSYAEKEEWYFGFASLKQLKGWFDTHYYYGAFGDDHLVVGVYEVDEEDFRLGDKQVIFVQCNAVHQRDLCLATLEEVA